MRRISLTVVALSLGVAVLANDKATETDTISMENIVDIRATTKTPKDFSVIVPQRIESLQNEKHTICERISDYKKSIVFKRKKSLILSSTGYFKPTITLGLSDLKTDSDGFCKKVNNEIYSIEAYKDLSASASKQYVIQLVEMREEVQAKYSKLPALLNRKIR